MKWLRRVIVVLAVFTVAVLTLTVTTALESRKRVDYPTGRTVSQTEWLVSMCAAYRNHEANPERGKYPATLAELAKPPFTGGPFLTHGEQDLIDPWGNPYRYAVVTSATGEQELYVWSERRVDGQLKLLGAKQSTNGSTELFGLK